ncbi:MAG: hypothetical protein HY706_10865 [Candidatus Hydrogenedentes bacterium]|nr:hypothetical protein [Candidatus Hydrogenedentota bacterium]
MPLPAGQVEGPTSLPHVDGAFRRICAAIFLVFSLVLPIFPLRTTASGAVLNEGVIEIEYDPADEAMARESMKTLQSALREFSQRLPAGEQAIHVVICNTRPEFAHMAGPYAVPNVTGIARPDLGLIAVKSPNLLPQGGDYEGTLRHELVHVLLVRNVNEKNLPHWLNEGITMVLSREHRWSSSLRVAQMYMYGSVIEYRELEFVFNEPGNEMEFGDAYAQSLSMTRYLLDRLGENRFWSMLRTLEHQSFGQALEQFTELTPYKFWEAWKNSLWKVALVSSLVSGFSLFQLMAILTLMAYLRKRRKGKEILQAWEEERGTGSTSPESYEEPTEWEDWYDDDEERW